jgi:hypothetical protein
MVNYDNKYKGSKEIKMTAEQKIKKQKWIEKNIDNYGNKVWKIHYIKNDCEYKIGRFWTRKEASIELKNM